MKAIRYCSVTNPWMDAVIFVPGDKVEDALLAINLGIDAYFDQESNEMYDLGYGDCIEIYLKDYGVTDFKILFYDEDESDEYADYDNIWEDMCKHIDGLITVG